MCAQRPTEAQVWLLTNAADVSVRHVPTNTGVCAGSLWMRSFVVALTRRGQTTEVTLVEASGAESKGGLRSPRLEPNWSQLEPSDPISVEQTLRNIVDAAIERKMTKAYIDTTSEGYVDLLKIAVAVKGYPLATGYTLEKLETTDESVRFRMVVEFAEERPPLGGTITVGKVGEVWKITAIKIPGIRE